MFDHANNKRYHALAPKFWPLWFTALIAWTVAQLPYSVQLKLGGALGKLAKKVLARQRHVTKVNLNLCFPELNSEQRQKLFDAYYRSFGISLVELCISGYTPKRRLAKLTQIEGLEHIATAHKKGQGVILITPHFTTLPLVSCLLGQFVPFDAVYRFQKNLAFNSIFVARAKRYQINILSRNKVNHIIKALNDNKILLYLPDQDLGKRHSIFAPFFGVPAATVTALARFAKINNSVVIPLFSYRKDDGKGYQIIVKPPLQNYPTTDMEKDSIRINKILETGIREHPEQYMWFYKRFRTRPEGEQNFYDQKHQ